MYDPLANEEPINPIPGDLVPRIAERALAKDSKALLQAFGAVYDAAVKNGIITEQEISKKFGKETLDLIRSKKSNPNPAQCRLVLAFIASKNPEEATGEKEPWRHTKPRTKEEPSPQPL